MKKYLLILLLSCSVSNAQYNLFARQNFAKSVSAPTFNTYIGGVSATISSASALATKLGISVGNISNFTIVGSDIKCKITGNYAIPSIAFQFNQTPCTYYTDSDYLVTALGNNAFYAGNMNTDVDFQNCITVGTSAITTSGKKILLKNATTIGDTGFYNFGQNTDIYYIPSVTALGSTSGNNSVFQSLKPTAKIYANPALATNNAGAPDGDLTYAIGQGATVAYVTNYTAPSAITDLAAGNIYNTAIQINFSTPSSSNAIGHYELYINGVYNRRIVSGDFVSDLTPATNYNFTVYATDVYYNRSLVSNSISPTTTNNTYDLTQGLRAYYRLDETSGTIAYDGFKSQNLTNTNVAINQSGKVGTSYYSSGNSKWLSGNLLTSISGNFSINLWMYRTGNVTADNAPFIRTGGYSPNSGFGMWLNTSNQSTWVINQNYNHYSSALAIPLNTWTMITMTYDGSNVRMYIDGVLKTTTAQTTNPNASTAITIFNEEISRNCLTRLDEASFYSIALPQGTINLHYNSGNGTTL